MRTRSGMHWTPQRIDAAFKKAAEKSFQKYLQHAQEAPATGKKGRDRTAVQYESRREDKPRMIRGFGGRLGGGFKRPRKLNLYGRKRRVARRLKKASKTFPGSQKVLSHIMDKGFLLTKEIGISGSADDAVYLGHSTYAENQYRLTIMAALLKLLLRACKQRMRNVDELVPFAPGTKIGISFKVDMDSNLATQTFVAAGVGGTPSTSTYYDIINNWVGVLNYNNPRFTLVDLFVDPADAAKDSLQVPVTVDISKASIQVWAKSAMKIQNATTSTAGAEADEVDNVPVTGKNYYGHGTGMIANFVDKPAADVNQFYTRTDAGFFKYAPLDDSLGMTEMPPLGYFRGGKAIGKHTINPGKIRYSTLIDSYTVSLNWLIKKIVFTTVPNQVCDLGKFRIFGFEHVIKATDDAPNIKMLAEVNYQVGMVVTPKISNVTDQYVSHGYYTY